MRYVSLQIRIGGTEEVIPEHTRRFHEAAIQLALDSRVDLQRIGTDATTIVDLRALDRQPELVGSALDITLERSAPAGRAVGVALIDLSSVSYYLLREQLLIALGQTMDALRSGDRCQRFVLLLQQLPLDMAASLKRLRGDVPHVTPHDSPGPIQMRVLANDGSWIQFDFTGEEKSGRDRRYAALVKRRTQNAKQQLRNHCIRRRGHFLGEGPDGLARCRMYSYHIVGAEKAFMEALTNWWEREAAGSTAILFDFAMSPALGQSVKAFADTAGVPAIRISDVLHSTSVQRRVRRLGKCTLMVEAVNHGTRLANYIRELKRRHIPLHANALAAILRLGGGGATILGHQVHGFVIPRREDREWDRSDCPQCQIGLPPMREDDDLPRQLRTYDVLSLARDYGWEPEPSEEVPPGAMAYPVLPRFGAMLAGEEGSWLGYKLYQLITDPAVPSPDVPAEWVLVHPDEVDSRALVANILPWFSVPPRTIRVDKESLHAARAEGWERILSSRTEAEQDWISNLRAIAAGPRRAAVVLDIFIGTGHTLARLTDLVSRFADPVLVACFMNFSPGTSRPTRVASLYDWHYPRGGSS